MKTCESLPNTAFVDAPTRYPALPANETKLPDVMVDASNTKCATQIPIGACAPCQLPAKETGSCRASDSAESGCEVYQPAPLGMPVLGALASVGE